MFAFFSPPPPAVGITPRSGEMAVTCAPKGQSVYKQEFVSGVRVHYCGRCFTTCGFTQMDARIMASRAPEL